MGADLVRTAVVEALNAIFQSDREADRALERTLRRHRDLDSDGRAAVARRVLGIACLRGRLEWRLDRVAEDWRSLPLPFRVAAYVLYEEGRTPDEAAEASGLPKEAMKGLDTPVQWPTDPVERLVAQDSLPRWLAERWHADFGADAPRLAAVSNRPGPTFLRANTLKTSRDALLQALADEGILATATRLSPLGVELAFRANLFGSRAWRDGLFEVQDEGSQLVALAVGARPGERCLDFCAGAGGKTLALAASMEDRGEILALDTDPRRLINLSARARRGGATIVRTRRIASDGPPVDWLADRVLVDAPCSSLGTLRRSPDLRWRLDPQAIPALAKTQREILERASACVRPGGLLVYATCTLTREENEGVQEAFSRAHPDWRPAPLRDGGPLRLLPHVHGTDGFFACAFRRPG